MMLLTSSDFDVEGWFKEKTEVEAEDSDQDKLECGRNDSLL
jgi:hypothetical protein